MLVKAKVRAVEGLVVNSNREKTMKYKFNDLDENLTREDKIFNCGFDKGFDKAKELKASYKLPIFTLIVGLIVGYLINF